MECIKGERWQQHRDTDYYVSDCGRVKRIYKSKEKLINPFIRAPKTGSKYMAVKIHGKEIKLARLVWETFNGKVPKGYNVAHKGGVTGNNDIRNLTLMTNKELGKKFGGRTSRAKVIYDADNDCFYRGTRRAGEALFISRQAVSDICNKKVKKPMFNLRWDD